MRIKLEVAIITGIILLGIVIGFYAAITIPWEDYFTCIMIGGHIPTGLRADYSCVQINLWEKVNDGMIHSLID